MQEVSSLIIVPKWRVLRPFEEVRVLGKQSVKFTQAVFGGKSLLSVHWIADPYDRMSRLLDRLYVSWKVRINLDVKA